jgi:predicted AlkP superfamily phosphohydrolase/phosphomutase
MPSPLKVLFLAIDAGDNFLIKKWANDGMLLTIRSLLEKGLVGETMSLEGLYEGATWPSFYTGAHPAHHGFHSLKQLNPGTYEFYRCYPGDFIKFEPFWKYLSAAGLRTAILDIPLSGISGGLNGIQMVEWGSHDGIYGFRTWPLKLKWDVLARFGRHPLRISCDSYQRTPHEFSTFKNKLINGAQKKAELTIHYLGKDNWNFFAQVFTEGHCIGHQCWHLHDPEHPSHDPQIANYMGDPIYDVYKAIDRAIGKILEHVTDDTIIFLLASHGMAHNVGGNFLLSEILERLDLAKKWGHDTDGRRPKSKNAIENIYNIIGQGWQKTPTAIKKRLSPTLFSLHNLILRRIRRRDLLMLPSSIAHIDLKNSKCFPLLNGNPVSGIRINLSGREPNGLIRPGTELNDFCDELKKDLLSIVDYDTGKPMVKKVTKLFKLYEGERVDHLPDLLVEWNDEKLLGSLGAGDVKGSRLRMVSEKIGIVEGVNTYCRTGDHRPEGFFIAVGPGINAGHMGRIVSIMDFAPTFTNLFGVEMPDTDGHPIIEILEMVKRFMEKRSQ